MKVIYSRESGEVLRIGDECTPNDDGEAEARFAANRPPFPFPEGWRVETVRRILTPAGGIFGYETKRRLRFPAPRTPKNALTPALPREKTPEPSLWFIVPAFKRAELSAICFEQQALARDYLRERGIAAEVLVIADDENLDRAAEHGLRTLERPNRLGAKLNAGYQLAASEGIHYVCPLGSDNWIEPARFLDLPEPNEILCTRRYAVVSPDGKRQARLSVGYDGGVGIRAIPLDLFAPCGFKPLDNARDRSCDTATLRMIRSRNQDVSIRYVERHAFDVVGFQSESVQITSYERLVGRFLLEEKSQPFVGLEKHYPSELVEKVKAFYANVEAERLSLAGA